MSKHTTVSEIHTSDLNNGTATYCPEDNKIRLYVGRVERETYNFLRANKFVATSKQTCDFVAVWSPKAEDIAFQLIAEDDDIQDEDYSPEDRAADRAERFAGYRDKRRSEAGGHADTYEDGPQAFGAQNAARAERQAARHERHRDRALCQWSKAVYWQDRTAGVISNALHRSDASTRRGRILTLEADQRKATPGGRWHDHLTMRLIYENAMLQNEGGLASVVEMIPGGWIIPPRRDVRFGRAHTNVEGYCQILKINKSPITGRVVSVAVLGSDPYLNDHKVKPRTINIERLGEGHYKAPTAEELEAFTGKKATAKASKPVVSTINPTDEDAQALQDLWNARAAENDAPGRTPAGTVAVSRMTQAGYSTRAKHDMNFLKEITENGQTFKIRCARGGGFYNYSAAYQVIVLTDKPQKPLPTGWNAPAAPAEAPQPEPVELIEEAAETITETIEERELAPAGCLF
jgi:hypothetical protein